MKNETISPERWAKAVAYALQGETIHTNEHGSAIRVRWPSDASLLFDEDYVLDFDWKWDYTDWESGGDDGLHSVGCVRSSVMVESFEGYTGSAHPYLGHSPYAVLKEALP